MSIKGKIALWYIRKQIAKAIKEASKMKPLPKWLAWVGNLGAFAALCTTLGGILPAKYGVALATFGAWLNSVTHSLPGTGGKPQ